MKTATKPERDLSDNEVRIEALLKTQTQEAHDIQRTDNQIADLQAQRRRIHDNMQMRAGRIAELKRIIEGGESG